MKGIWIKCSEEMPGKWQRVLTFTDNKEPILIGKWCGREWYFESHRDKNGAEIPVPASSVFYWMLLPGNPK